MFCKKSYLTDVKDAMPASLRSELLTSYILIIMK